MNIRLTILAGLLLAFLAGPSRVGGAANAGRQPDENLAPKVKAGMILNFVRYTEWPAEAFPTQDGPLVVTILGDCPMTSHIVATFNNQRVHDRNVEVRRVQYPKPLNGESVVSADRHKEFTNQLRASHVLCICESERARLGTILKDLKVANVLTVSDIEDFASRGGMLGLTIRNGRVAFDANQKRIGETRLKVSSQLMRLARVVEPKGVDR
jgi:hypothetical protein